MEVIMGHELPLYTMEIQVTVGSTIGSGVRVVEVEGVHQKGLLLMGHGGIVELINDAVHDANTT